MFNEIFAWAQFIERTEQMVLSYKLKGVNVHGLKSGATSLPAQ